MTESAIIRITPEDSVGTTLRAVAVGETLSVGDATLIAAEAVPAGHKIALRSIRSGDPVIKFGFPIGTASSAISAGAHVHSHNLATALAGTQGYRYMPDPFPLTKRDQPQRNFEGYLRADGRAATRNEIWVLPTVGCVARTAEKIAASAHARHRGTVDGVYAFKHPFGCSQLGDDLGATRTVLAGLASNPNAAGVLIVGLGCESNQTSALLETIAPEIRRNIRVLGAQQAGDEVADGVALVDALVASASFARRTTIALDKLVIGVKCGGSDGYSGLTANPLVGRISDAVTDAGGTAILTEIPEIFGAEELLMRRAADEHVFDATVALVNSFKRYFIGHGEPVSENPSPGNIAGGITTLEEKSLGAVQKAGHARVTDVRLYGERVRHPGLTLLEAPGNDAVSSTALAAAGATLILFTTGRGTPLGFPVPTIKIASNSELAARKPGWIDFDAGSALTHGFNAATDALLDVVLATASGTPTAAERNDEREIALWKRGVTL
ncbi:UxaA family hydrolase [Sphingomonas cavernae]|uniref:Altronate dehydratase n=1 Tax=Sphingomonas cavernae TaxID=2320861 RepID=A0A418WLM8_9SPHN|nr:altronate dehydratase family protein [Sphingomonas cavernae]RJF90951.1 altronate dehydratase [Sphingomonas cavernae]